jgi:hypothetical protein
MNIIDASNIELTADFTEPTTQASGAPLTGLVSCTVVNETDGTSVVDTNVSSTGGNNRSVQIPLAVAAGESKSFSFHMIATNTSGVNSAPTTSVTFVVDRTAPSAPSNFSVS